MKRMIGISFWVALVLVGNAAISATTETFKLSGNPGKNAVVGQQYSFAPIVSGAGGHPVKFWIANRPTWAHFSSGSGILSGIPKAPGVAQKIVIFASNGSQAYWMPAFDLTVSGSSATAPTISGSPATTAVVGTAYSFQPTVSNASGTLSFTITNRPTWASFSSVTGRLTGTPTAPGVASNMVITVNNGKASASLPSFSVTVKAAPATVKNFSLAITVAGSGSVADTSGTISCNANCTKTLASATSLRLNATAASGYTFKSWSGGCVGNTVCALVIAANTAVTANFEKTVVSVPTPPAPPTAPPAAPPAAGTPYPSYTYALPSKRPFISLAQYASASLTGAPVSRLKAQVDDVVVVTKAQGANTTYDKLVSALNSDHYGFSPVDSVIMFRLTGNTAYIDQAIRMVDLFVISENARISSGQVPRIAGDSYLEVGQYLSELSLAYDYGYDRLTPSQRATWSSFADQTVYNVWNYNKAVWGSVSRPWTGWSVNDPGNNYYYSFLRATQLWALATQNQSWISFLQTQKYTQLVPFFSLLTGGGSREGTGYGTALGALFEDYSYWKDSTGEDLSAYSTHARDTIDYWVYATVPTFQYFAAIGDQSRSSMPIMFDYQRKLVIEAVGLNPGTAQAKRGVWWLNRAQLTDGGNGWQVGSMRYNYDFKYDLIATNGTEQAPTALSYSSTGTGALFARSDWSTTASWMHLNVGYYDQSHAHQDQGSFSFFKGKWLSIGSNVHSSSGINQGTDVENVLRFDDGSTPVPQNNSVSTKTVSDSGDTLQVSANLTPAYSSNSARVSKWTRDFTYQRSNHSLRIHDVCSVRSGITPVWQLHLPVAPVRQSDGSYLAGSLRIVPSQPSATAVTGKIVSMPSVSSDFTSGYRLELRDSSSACEFTVTLLAQ